MRLCFAACCLILIAHTARAQATAAALAIGGLDKLFERVESVNLYYGRSFRGPAADSLSPDGAVPWKRDYGLEFLIHAGDGGKGTLYGNLLDHFRSDAEKNARKQQAAAEKAERAAKDSVIAKLYDTTKVIVKSTFDSASLGKADPTKPQTGKPDTPARPPKSVETDVELTVHKNEPDDKKLFEFDIGIGYGQLDGITAHRPLEMHANVRELPAISLYGNVQVFDWLQVYIGGRTGLISLQDAQFYFRGDTTTFNYLTPPSLKDSSFTVFSAGASTFEYGAALGVDIAFKKLDLTVEYASHRRHFNSLNYSPNSPLPFGLPHELDLTGRSFEVAIQVGLPKKP